MGQRNSESINQANSENRTVFQAPYGNEVGHFENLFRHKNNADAGRALLEYLDDRITMASNSKERTKLQTRRDVISNKLKTIGESSLETEAESEQVAPAQAESDLDEEGLGNEARLMLDQKLAEFEAQRIDIYLKLHQGATLEEAKASVKLMLNAARIIFKDEIKTLMRSKTIQAGSEADDRTLDVAA
jgi:hypothetical protein